MKQKQNAAKPQIDRLVRQNEIRDKIETLKIRIPIAKYGVARTHYDNLRQEKQEAKTRKNELEQQTLPLTAKVGGYENRRDRLKRNIERTKKEFDNLVREVKNDKTKNAKFEEEANGYNREVENIKKSQRSRKAKIIKMKEEISKLATSVEKAQEAVNSLHPNWKEEMEAQKNKLRGERRNLANEQRDTYKALQNIDTEVRAIKRDMEPQEAAYALWRLLIIVFP